MVVTKVGIYGLLTVLINNPRPDCGLVAWGLDFSTG